MTYFNHCHISALAAYTLHVLLFALILSSIGIFSLSSLAGNILQQHIPSLSSLLSCFQTHQVVISPMLYNLFYDPWWPKLWGFWFTFFLDSPGSLYNSSASLPTTILNDMKQGKKGKRVFFFLYYEKQEIAHELRSTHHEKQRIVAEFQLPKQLPRGSQELDTHSC